MRSSKSRPRNKPNRSRPSTGNVVNRTFDSSGPEGKVRGTPQQIIEKYNQLARDAQLAGDRVASENFQQHAEHYLRLLGEAQKEQEARREELERQNRERQAERDRERPQGERGQNNGERQGNGHGDRDQNQNQHHNTGNDGKGDDLAAAPQPDVIDSSGHKESGLVETPESQSAPMPPKRPRKPRVKRPPKPDAQSNQGGQSDQGDDQGNGTPTPSGPAEAAE